MVDQETQTRVKQEVENGKEGSLREGAYFSPAVDIFGSPKELVLVADMPGVDANEVEVELEDDTLTITGRLQPGREDTEPLLTEYRSGNYFRTFRINEVIDQGRITASMTDGVLTVVLPRIQRAIPRKISITSD